MTFKVYSSLTYIDHNSTSTRHELVYTLIFSFCKEEFCYDFLGILDFYKREAMPDC